MRRYPLLVILPATLALLTGASLTGADDALPAQPSIVDGDRHISWHEFRHELNAYPQATSTMDRDGVVWIRGHVESGIERVRLERLARKVRGATDIRNHLQTD